MVEPGNLSEHPPVPLVPGRGRLRIRRFLKVVAALLFLGGLGAAGYFTQDRWLPLLFPPAKDSVAESISDPEEAAAPSEQVLLSAQAQKNLRLTSKPLKVDTFWKTISVPGMVIDRPGFSDRGVVAPVTGIVSRIHKIAGDTVKPGDVLFTLKLLSESLHQTQTELFKASQDIKLLQTQLLRLKESAGAISEARIIEVENQITRFQIAVKAYRQELVNRGLMPSQIEKVTEGTFVSEIPITAPNRTAAIPLPASKFPQEYEIQELKVELGQQVQAGQTLCLLANHQLLAIEGRAFRDESPLLERVVKEGWPIEVDFEEEKAQEWPAQKQTFTVTYVANTIDPESRTFRFLMPLDNQSRLIERVGKSQTLWRFRPGQRVRLLVRVESLENVFVLPADAVARDGADAYVFRQNGDIFDRKPVQVVYRDSRTVVLANDGSVPPGIYIAQTGAAQLNRMVKSQSGTTPKGFHIHADGSVHMGAH
jgi:cobalt-zinc-cadmium efflux system membrane fusion protein